jgi:hypothetical protein
VGEVQEFDVRMLVEGARRSCCSESYQVLDRARAYRISIGARIDEFGNATCFLDIILNMCPGDPMLSVPMLERNISLLKDLKERGYALSCEEGQVTCEAEVVEGLLVTEYEDVKRLVEKHGLR